jgi:STE24 endopeptidase
MPTLLAAFIAASTIWTGLALWLGARQVACVRRNRDAVPADFAGTVTLEEHRKGADYTVARERLASLRTLLDLAITLAWVLGGINLLYGALAVRTPPALGRGVLFLLVFFGLSALLSLPLDVYRTFVLEQKFGFNRTTRLTFAADRLKSWAIGLIIAVPLLFAALWVMRDFAGLWWLWTWCGVVALMLAAPSVALQHIHPTARRSAGAHRNPAARVRLSRLGPVQHGRVAPVRARQRVFHRLRRHQTGGAVRHPDRGQHAGRNRGRGGP